MSASTYQLKSPDRFAYSKPSAISLYVLLAALGVIFLPFTKALTINIGFPLKIYEMCFVLAIPLFMVGRQSVPKWFVKKHLIYALALLVVAIYSSLLMMLDVFPTTEVTYRGGKVIDSLMRVSYLTFNIMVFVLVFYAATKNQWIIVRCWFAGVLLAFLYHSYTFLSVGMTGDAFLLPGLERHQMGWVGPVLFPRSGVFEEGNFAGLYYLASTALALHQNKHLFAIMALCGVCMTLSTSTIASAIIFFIVYMYSKHKFSYKHLTLLVGIILLGYVLYTGLDIGSKFEQRAGESGAVRLNEAMTGLNIFYSRPLLGAGMGQYGYLFNEFEWNSDLRVIASVDKHIPNNVYIELMSELGIIGLSIFLLFGWNWTRSFLTGVYKSYAFFAFGVSTIVALLAYPTFNITYLWCFAGLGLALNSSGEASEQLVK